jgi:hypothetical protein
LRLLALGALAVVLGAVLYHQNPRPDSREASHEDGKPSVLFVGNSFTSVNDLPGTFARVALSLGDRVAVGAHAPGGQTFEGHLKDPEVLKKIMARDWDFIVLQEQSQRPSFGPEQVEAETVAPALKLNKMIREAHPSTRVVFYETWGRRNGDPDNCKNLPNLCAYEGLQNRLNESYALMARRSSALLAPVGEAWSKVRAEHPEIDLYAADGVHPSLSGTYLAACVFYASLLRKPATGADALGLDRREALLLQQTADRAVFGLTAASK